MEGKVPPRIKSRTRFHRVCLGKKDEKINGKVFLSWKSLNSLVGRTVGPNYLKIDIEGISFFATYKFIYRLIVSLLRL